MDSLKNLCFPILSFHLDKILFYVFIVKFKSYLTHQFQGFVFKVRPHTFHFIAVFL